MTQEGLLSKQCLCRMHICKSKAAECVCAFIIFIIVFIIFFIYGRRCIQYICLGGYLGGLHGGFRHGYDWKLSCGIDLLELNC